MKHAFAAKCFPEGSEMDRVESRPDVKEQNVQWTVQCSSGKSRRTRTASMVDLPALYSDFTYLLCYHSTWVTR